MTERDKGGGEPDEKPLRESNVNGFYVQSVPRRELNPNLLLVTAAGTNM